MSNFSVVIIEELHVLLYIIAKIGMNTPNLLCVVSIAMHESSHSNNSKQIYLDLD